MRRHAPRGQGGFALVTVLAVILVTSLLIGALFGLMLSTIRLNQAQERASREGRAADAAVETAINELREGTCDPTSQPFIEDLRFDQQTGATGDDVEVDVTCGSVAGGESLNDQVRIVGGDGYRGALAPGWTQDCASSAAAGCMPWAAAVGSVPSGLASSRVSVVHSGPEPLDFSSGVTVRTGAAALRNPTSGAPAIEVGGQYNQGSPGLVGSSTTDCGMLAGSPGDGAGEVVDLDDEPRCGVPEAAAVDAQPTGNSPGLVPSAAVPVVPTTCGPGPVVTFTEGTYSAAQTEQVSKLTDGSIVACRNKTFHFLPGIYLFLGPQLRFGDATSYYVIGAAEPTWGAGGVQGVPALVADVEARLCSPETSGASLVVAGWTRLIHTAGRVAMCPAWPTGSTDPADAHPALYQQTVVPTGVQVTSIIRAPAVTNTAGITIPFRCRTIGVYPGTADYPNGLGGVCRPQRTYELRLASDGQAPITSMRVMLTGSESNETPNNLITNRQTRLRLFTSGTVPICQTDFVTGMPNGGMTSSFDLKAMPGTCSTTAINQSQLNGARLFVDHRMDLGLVSIVQTFDVTRAEVEINAVAGLPSEATSSDWTNPSAVTEVGGASATPVMPSGCTDFVCQVADPGRAITPSTPFVHEMQLSGFTFPGLLNSSDPDVDPSLRTLRAVVRVRPSSLSLPSSWTAAFGNLISAQNFLTPGTVRLELRSPAGGRCIVQGRGINSDQEIAFDLLSADLADPTATDCNTFIFENASDLDDVTMRLRFELPCVPDYNLDPNGRLYCLRQLFENPSTSPALPVWQIRPPDIDSVQLTTVTDTYSRAETSTVTVNATGGASSSSFNVFGRTWMPLADLDINWNGPSTAQPLFANDLVLHGLGSRMAAGAAMGTVCCDPPETRTVELVAVIDGVERLVVRAEYTDVRDVGGVPVYEPGFAVDVLRWLTCGPAGCAAALSASDEAPEPPEPPGP